MSTVHTTRGRESNLTHFPTTTTLAVSAEAEAAGTIDPLTHPESDATTTAAAAAMRRPRVEGAATAAAAERPLELCRRRVRIPPRARGGYYRSRRPSRRRRGSSRPSLKPKPSRVSASSVRRGGTPSFKHGRQRRVTPRWDFATFFATLHKQVGLTDS